MKKLLFGLGILISSFGFSQLHSVGFHLGAMGTSLRSSFNNGDSKAKVDFLGGLNYQYRFSNHFTAGAQLEYAQFGARVPITYSGSGSSTEIAYSSYDWNYISIPLTAGFQFGGKIRLQPKAGIVPSILSRMVYNFQPPKDNSLTPFKASFYSDARKFDLGLIGGVDISVPFHAGVVFLGIDFRYSITKLNTETLFNETFNDTYRNKGISSVIGVKFNLGVPEPEGPKDIIDDPVK